MTDPCPADALRLPPYRAVHGTHAPIPFHIAAASLDKHAPANEDGMIPCTGMADRRQSIPMLAPINAVVDARTPRGGHAAVPPSPRDVDIIDTAAYRSARGAEATSSTPRNPLQRERFARTECLGGYRRALARRAGR